MAINVGDKIPTVDLSIMTADGPEGISTDDIFGGKKVAIFGLPGAFTPTCSAKHLPGFVNNAERSRPRASTPSSVWRSMMSSSWAPGARTRTPAIM